MSQNGQSVSNNFGTLGIKGLICFFSHVISFSADTNKVMQSAKAAHKIIRNTVVMEYFTVNWQIYNLKREFLNKKGLFLHEIFQNSHSAENFVTTDSYHILYNTCNSEILFKAITEKYLQLLNLSDTQMQCFYFENML